MRFAISTEDNRGLESNVSQHFGRCPYFVIVDFEDEAVEEVKVVDNPFFAGHGPGQVPEYIASLEANVMICGGMGRRADEFFDHYGIQTATGAVGTAQEALTSFQEGNCPKAETAADMVRDMDTVMVMVTARTMLKPTNLIQNRCKSKELRIFAFVHSASSSMLRRR